MTSVGAVAIGRNEGERLQRCLESVQHATPYIVYVDSGSTDGSVEWARERDIDVVELDLSEPFTAARARNAGVERLLDEHPELEFVQFLDGDCELVGDWIPRAEYAFDSRPDVAVVCGRRRERHPGATIYNLMCDIEWNTPVGEANSCGGDALVRLSAFKEVGGFDPTLIAGEEPDLCVRLRLKSWAIVRIDAEMTVHDAAMTRFSQWWMRAVRAGHSYAEGYHKHGKGPSEHWRRDVRSIVAWSLVLPLVIALTTWPTHGWSLLLLALYPVLGYRVYRYLRGREFSRRESRLYAVFCVLCKWPQLIGMLKYHRSRLTGRERTLIEYKGAGENAAPSESASDEDSTTDSNNADEPERDSRQSGKR